VKQPRGTACLLILFATLLSHLLLSTPAAAETPGEAALGDTVYEVSEILVEAQRVSDVSELKSRPAFVSIVPIDDATHRVSSAADYIARAAGCHVRSTGGYGAYSTASVRGSSAKQVRVYLDGIPLAQAQSGIFDLADIPVASLERIEVYRGFGPNDLSGSSIGGVINLVSKKTDRKGQGQISASFGSLSTQRYQGSYGLGRAGWNVLIVGGALVTDGDYEFLDDNGTPFNAADDAIVRRTNNGVEEYEALVKATGEVGSGTLVVSNQFYHRRQGLPGYGVLQSETERMTRRYNLTHLSWRAGPWVELPVETEIGVFYQDRVDHFQDLREKTPGVKPDERNSTRLAGANLRWALYLGRYRQKLRGLVSASRETFAPEEISSASIKGERQTRDALTLTLEDDIGLIRDRFRIVLSGRHETYSDHFIPFTQVRADLASYYRGLVEGKTNRSLTLGTISAVISPVSGVSLKANYGRHYRIPSLMELYGYRGMVLPNPGLLSEVGLNRDIGIGWEKRFGSGRFVSAEYAYFWSDVDRVIMFAYVPFANAAQAVNVDRAEIDGSEFSLTLGAWLGFSLTGNLTYLRAVNTGPVSYTNCKRLPNRPELEGFAQLRWARRGVSAFYEYTHIAGNYWNASNGMAPNNKGPLFPTRRLHSMGLKVPTGVGRSSLSVEVRNLADEQYEDVMGFPLPGRAVYATIMVDV
jgi:iron complex outermembrane receptor protein